MATSGSSNFTATRDQIVKAAYRKIGAIRGTATPSDQMIQDGAFALNALVKHWQGRGLHVWTVTEATLFPQPGQIEYTLSIDTTSDHATESYVTTALSAAAASGASSLTVDSITGLSNGDTIGVVTDDGTIHWTTINGAPAGSTVTLTTGLDDSSALGNKVYAYTNKIIRPLKVVDARWEDAATGIESPVITMISRLDYRRLPNKNAAGDVSTAFYDPQLNAGKLHLWHVPNPFQGFVNFTWYRPIQDFDAAGNNPDLPQEWIQTLIYNLAATMMDEFEVDQATYARIEAKAASLLDDMEGWDREEEPIQFRPDMGFG